MKMSKEQLQKKLVQNSASRHDLWEGSGVLLKADDFSDELKRLTEERESLVQQLDFLKDRPSTHVELKAGWYQDAAGNLFKYDNVIWDPIPDSPIQDLEYLSGQ